MGNDELIKNVMELTCVSVTSRDAILQKGSLVQKNCIYLFSYGCGSNNFKNRKKDTKWNY